MKVFRFLDIQKTLLKFTNYKIAMILSNSLLNKFYRSETLKVN